MIRHENFAGLWLAQAADQRQKSGFADGSPAETFDGEFVLKVKIFRGMIPPDDFDAGRICDRLRYAFRRKGVSCQRVSGELGLGKDLLHNYLSRNYCESSMQVEILIKLADYFGEETYYFCNDYHKFLATVDGGMFLRKMKQKYHMTRKEFAGYLGVSFSAYRAYESGKSRLPRNVFERLKDEAESPPA